jgi:hypothetical protein
MSWLSRHSLPKKPCRWEIFAERKPIGPGLAHTFKNLKISMVNLQPPWISYELEWVQRCMDYVDYVEYVDSDRRVCVTDSLAKFRSKWICLLAESFRVPGRSCISPKWSRTSWIPFLPWFIVCHKGKYKVSQADMTLIMASCSDSWWQRRLLLCLICLPLPNRMPLRLLCLHGWGTNQKVSYICTKCANRGVMVS